MSKNKFMYLLVCLSILCISYATLFKWAEECKSGERRAHLENHVFFPARYLLRHRLLRRWLVVAKPQRLHSLITPLQDVRLCCWRVKDFRMMKAKSGRSDAYRSRSDQMYLSCATTVMSRPTPDGLSAYHLE